MRFDSSISILLAGVLATGALACQKDEFADAPTAQASSSAPASATSPQMPTTTAPTTRSAGALPEGAKMPSNHPPVGAGMAPGPMAGDKAPRPRAPVTGDKATSYGKTGPLRWEAPAGWQGVRPSSSMRMAEYLVPGADGAEAAVVSVFYFGAAGGGGVDANIDRWVGQFQQPDGSPSAQVAKRSKQTVNGMTVHLVDVSGIYNAGAAMAAGGGGGSKKDQRVLGAIIEAPAGLFFFKLLGPVKTIAANEAGFDALVKSFSPGS